ncbi:hypothetical protein AB447_209210 [Bacillus glycinifermentans]|uniref:Uncharacterized protein n=1 Tax=Bacillus glycinifermentans TaxID=1664069 RepID=A0A0T6BIB1_9BACI|nr:hypothetical protein [Bacillus sonorensis]KRT87135.1 hypothetical protein AB447_209210 [Bacillus glycinifermentans]MEC0457510.1 hypothetical protein [Bacillus sonorensis]MEC0530695.1 hypothetical protein [Bacillus sonorensis]
MAGCVFEQDIRKIHQLKIDLLKIAKCIDTCSDKEKSAYQDIACEYSKALKTLKKSIEEAYGVKLCCCPLQP